MLDRFTFLKALGATAIWPWLDGAPLFAAIAEQLPAETAAAAPQFDLLNATAASFRSHLDTTFLVRSESGARVAMRLAAVVERPQSANFEQFSLRFHALEGPTNLEGIRTFEHRGLGYFEMFIAAVGGATVDRVVYEACLSRTVGHV